MTKALVVVELPTMRSVILARVATSDRMKELVVVAFVVDALRATRLVLVALIAVRLEVEAFVKNPLVAVIGGRSIVSSKCLDVCLSCR